VSMVLDRKGNNKSAVIKPSVKSEKGPVSGADVQVMLTKPNGAVAQFFVTTGADGTTTINYQLKPKDPSGTYQVKTTATKDGVTGVTTTSFAVP